MSSETPAPPETSAMVGASKPAPAPAKPTTALAPGFRFHPTDEELVSYYLKRKVSSKPVRFEAIAEVDIYKNEPWELADKSRLKTRDQEWYFFCALDKKYGNGARMNRATGHGYWKATGKDREIRRDLHLIAMKKTLVFHSGRAPGGQRTNWVMHEYRLADEELERIGVTQNDSYVLCRVFHKNNIGPPNGNRYAPYMEEEWDDGQSAFIPSADPVDEVVTGRDASRVNRVEQETLDLDLRIGELPRKSPNVLPVCKSEREEDCPPLCVLNTEAPFALLKYKRRKNNNDVGSNHSNASDDSIMTLQGPSSSSTTTAETTVETMATSVATRTAISALLEFSRQEPIEPKESPNESPSTFDVANLDQHMPPGCMKFVHDLQDEIRKISVERESLRLDMMGAQAMINILQSRIGSLTKENEDLKGSIQDDGEKKQE
uniref:NAC transcription factor NAM-A1 n=1 Tax=Rhizophora mucronata TaxID=61149 RepID=A0A2P2J8R5_RHIMU